MTERRGSSHIVARFWRDYSFGLIVGALFLLSLIIFLIAGWSEYVREQIDHTQPIEFGAYWNLMLRDITENWQSEFLEILAEVILLRYFLFKDSPMSREQQDRMERKLDEIRRTARQTEDVRDELRQLRRAGHI